MRSEPRILDIILVVIILAQLVIIASFIYTRAGGGDALQQPPPKEYLITEQRPEPEQPSGKELPSPADHIKEEEIVVLKSGVRLNIQNVEWTRFTDTNSMDPLIDVGTNGLHVVPASPQELSIGDVISYTPDIAGYEDKIIIHRIIQIGEDGQGWYAIAKGDNLPYPDPGKIRFSQVRRVLIGVIY